MPGRRKSGAPHVTTDKKERQQQKRKESKKKKGTAPRRPVSDARFPGSAPSFPLGPNVLSRVHRATYHPRLGEKPDLPQFMRLEELRRKKAFFC
jgi:hypothetical protein